LAACPRPVRVQGSVATSRRLAEEGCVAELPGLELATGRRLDLTDIVEVEGDFVVFNELGTERFSLAKLERVAGSMLVHSDWVRSLRAPRLEQVGGSVVVVDSDRLNSVALPRLRTVALGLTVADNDVLQVLDMQRLADVGDGMTLVRNAAMEGYELPRLERVRQSLVVDEWTCDAEVLDRMWSREAGLEVIASGEVCRPGESG
ncbi:MAG: hypothetical protein AAF211_17785, partial [Myxococcota bacterium]